MPIQNPICRVIDPRTLHDEFGVRFGVLATRRRSSRSSRRESCPKTRQIWRLGCPVAGAHRSMPNARAAALLQWTAAVGLRALAHVSATFYCNSPLLWPPTHFGRSWVPRWREQETKRRAKTETACGRSASAFPKMPAARPAPDRRHSPSLRSVASMSAVRRASRSKRSTRSVALGSAPSLVARWDSLLLLLRPFQSALGRFLHLSPPGGSSSLFSGPVGACANFAKPAKFLQHSLPFARALFALRHGAGCVCARPNSRRVFSARLWTLDQSSFKQFSNSTQSASKPFQRSISHHANY